MVDRENLILEHLRHIRAAVDSTRDDIRGLTALVGHLEEQVNSIYVQVAELHGQYSTLYSQYATLTNCMDRVDQRLERIDRRLETSNTSFQANTLKALSAFVAALSGDFPPTGTTASSTVC
jgi:chromosome segregation ATPase